MEIISGMKKMFYLSTCSTCKRIIEEINLPPEIVLQDIKTEKICENQLNELISLSGNVESLFSKRSMKYRAWGLHEKALTDMEMKALIIQEYTFLKRPVLVIDDQIFIGNSKKVVASMKEALVTLV